MDFNELFARIKKVGGTIREVPIDASVLVESGANTFTDGAIVLSSYFTQKELDRGVFLAASKCDITQLPAAAAVNNRVNTHVGLVKDDLASLPTIANTKVLYKKVLYGNSGAAAECMNYQTAVTFPENGILNDQRDRKVDRNDPDTWLYWFIKSTQLSAVNSANMILYFML